MKGTPGPGSRAAADLKRDPVEHDASAPGKPSLAAAVVDEPRGRREDRTQGAAGTEKRQYSSSNPFDILVGGTVCQSEPRHVWSPRSAPERQIQHRPGRESPEVLQRSDTVIIGSGSETLKPGGLGVVWGIAAGDNEALLPSGESRRAHGSAHESFVAAKDRGVSPAPWPSGGAGPEGGVGAGGAGGGGEPARRCLTLGLVLLRGVISRPFR